MLDEIQVVQKEDQNQAQPQAQNTPQKETYKQVQVQYLLNLKGRLDIFTGKFTKLTYSEPIPVASAICQIGPTLYVCGGQKLRNDKEMRCIDSFFSSDFQGNCILLSPMGLQRSRLSLSGNQNDIIAIGGFKQFTRNECQIYSFKKCQWKWLKCLNQAREWSGSCIVNSNIAYTFCGRDGNEKVLNSVQLLDISKGHFWIMVHLIKQIEPCYSLTALELKSKIVLFGGVNQKVMYIFNLEGDKFVQCHDVNIPPYISWGSAIVKKNYIYAVGKTDSWEVFFFDGKRWRILNL